MLALSQKGGSWFPKCLECEANINNPEPIYKDLHQTLFKNHPSMGSLFTGCG